MSIQETKLSAIADAIREKEGSSGLIPAENFAERILALKTGGVPAGAYAINLQASDPEGGTVHGGGIASKDMSINISVEVKDRYVFDGWMEGGDVISRDPDFTLSVQKDRNLVANILDDISNIGVKWYASAIPSAPWNSVTYGNGKFVAVAYNSSQAAYSTDGITWEATTLPSSDSWRSVTYGNGRFVAIASSSDQAAYS